MRNANTSVRTAALGLILALVAAISGCAKPDPNAPLIGEGFAALGVDNADAAIANADAFLAKSPTGKNAAEAYYLRGRGYELRAVKDPADAGPNLQSARAAYMSGLDLKPTGDLKCYLHSSLGNVAFFQDDYSTALGQWGAAYPMASDRETKAWMLYRMGLCQQRTGRFETADETYDRVRRQYPNTEPARRSSEKMGVRKFSVVVGTAQSRQGAVEMMDGLKAQGISAVATNESSGIYQIRVPNLASYDLAQQTRRMLITTYPGAVVIP